MDTITRAEAIEKGLKTYFTGNPCPKGHIALRTVKKCSCVACDKALAAKAAIKYYKANSETILEKAWAKRNTTTGVATFAYIASVLTTV